MFPDSVRGLSSSVPEQRPLGLMQCSQVMSVVHGAAFPDNARVAWGRIPIHVCYI